MKKEDKSKKILELSKYLYKTIKIWSGKNENIPEGELVQIIHAAVDHLIGAMIHATSEATNLTKEDLLNRHDMNIKSVIYGLENDPV